MSWCLSDHRLHKCKSCCLACFDGDNKTSIETVAMLPSSLLSQSTFPQKSIYGINFCYCILVSLAKITAFSSVGQLLRCYQGVASSKPIVSNPNFKLQGCWLKYAGLEGLFGFLALPIEALLAPRKCFQVFCQKCWRISFFEVRLATVHRIIVLRSSCCCCCVVLLTPLVLPSTRPKGKLFMISYSLSLPPKILILELLPVFPPSSPRTYEH